MKPVLKELTGTEFREIAIEDICTQFRVELERQLDATNRFLIGNSYPAATIRGNVTIKVMPKEKLPEPIVIPIVFDYGTNLETALDRIREAHGLDVLQPQKTKSGMVVNQTAKEK